MNLNQELARAFNEIADLLELQDANTFRVRAYRAAAAVIQNLPRSVDKIPREKIEQISGIGKDLAAKISEFAENGRIEFLERERRKFPRGFLQLLAIPTLGPKTAKLFFEKLEIKNLRDLKRAAKSGALLALPGIKEKTVENILAGIELLAKNKIERRPISEVLPIARKILRWLKNSKTVERIEIAGSLRRKRATIGDVDLLGISKNPERAMEVFVKFPEVRKIIGRGKTKSSTLLENGLQVDLRIVSAGSFGAAWLYFTGSKNYNIELRKIAIRNGWKLNEYGLFRISDGRKIAGETEKEIYKKLGINFLPPEKREF